MKLVGLLPAMIAAALWTASLEAADPPANPRTAVAAPTAPTARAATPQDDDEEPDPTLSPQDVQWKRDQDFRFYGNSLAASLTTLDGATLQLPRDALGKLTVLHFWSTQGTDIPHMRALYDEYHHRGLQIIGINVDRDRAQVEAFIRQQDIAWPQVCSGKGADDPLLTRLTGGVARLPRSGKGAGNPAAQTAVPARPYWLIGWDGRVVSTARRTGWMPVRALDEALNNRTEIESELGERFSFYRSGEFLAFTPLLDVALADAKSTIPPAALTAIRAKLHMPGWTAGSKADKIRSFKEVLAAGQALEQRYPGDPDLPVVRSWMLIAARWLAITTGEKALGREAAAIANRLLASHATPAAGVLADYVVTSARLAERKSRTKAGSRLIQDYAARHAGSDAVGAARILAVMLTLEDAQNVLRQQLVQQLYVWYELPGPLIYAFLRDCCEEKLPGGGRAQLFPAERGTSAPSGAVKDAADDLRGRTDLAQRLPAAFYRSGEFIIPMRLLRTGRGDPKGSIPRENVEAVRTTLLAAGREGVGRADKIQSYKDLFTAVQSLEQRYPDAGELQLIRSWMMIAARWLAISTQDNAFHKQAAATANRVLARNPGGPVRMMADYIVTSAQLAEFEPHSQAGIRLIQDFAARYEDGWLVRMLAVMLTFDGAEDGLREQLTAQLHSMCVNRPGTLVYGFLRDCCDKNCKGPYFHAQLTRMDGRSLVLPDDLLGKVVIIQFWSAAHPPTPFLMKDNDRNAMPYTGTASVPSEGVVVVGVNLDRNRADAEAFLKQSRYPDWIHTFSGLGWDDPTARTCDVLALPRTVVLNRYGEIAVVNRLTHVTAGKGFIYGVQAWVSDLFPSQPVTAGSDFMHGVARLVAEPATRPPARK